MPKKKANVQNLAPLDYDPHSVPQSDVKSHSLDYMPTEQFHLRRYSSSEREDYAFGSVSLESAPKGGIGHDAATRKFHVSSPPLTDRRHGNKGNFTPRSPARTIVQTPGSGAYAYSSLQTSPPEVF